MKFLNKFMNIILKCQKGLGSFEKLSRSKVKVLSIGGIMFLSFIIFFYAKCYLIAEVFGMLLLFFIIYFNVQRWHSSVIQLFKVVFYFNAVFIAFIISVVFDYLKQNSNYNFDFLTIFIPLYFVLWFFTSMVAKCEVAKLVNEVVSALLTIIFTAGTYLSSILFNTYPSLDVIERTYRNEKELEAALSNNTNLVWDILPSIINFALNKIYLFVLPFLCISIFSLALINVKKYWLKKNGEKEYWDESYKKDSLLNQTNVINVKGNDNF